MPSAAGIHPVPAVLTRLGDLLLARDSLNRGQLGAFLCRQRLVHIQAFPIDGFHQRCHIRRGGPFDNTDETVGPFADSAAAAHLIEIERERRNRDGEHAR